MTINLSIMSNTGINPIRKVEDNNTPYCGENCSGSV